MLKSPTEKTLSNLEAGPLAIDVRHLPKSFGDRQVLYDLSLSIEFGEVCAFLGPNGSGKTTTIRLLCGLLKPDQGTGTCLGYDVLTEAKLIKRHIGYMTQKFSLYEDLSVIENLNFIANVYGLANPKAKVKSSLERLCMSTSVQCQLAGSLSGGWKQRLALAATILHEPKLLLLDEPTAGVDPYARRIFWGDIHRLAKQGVTVLVSTHYMDELERCHRLLYITNGRLLAQGGVEDLIANINIAALEVRGENLTVLADKLDKHSAVCEVAYFGQYLRVTGKDIVSLEKVMHFFGQGYSYKPIHPTFEDIFVHLLSKS